MQTSCTLNSKVLFQFSRPLNSLSDRTGYILPKIILPSDSTRRELSCVSFLSEFCCTGNVNALLMLFFQLPFKIVPVRSFKNTRICQQDELLILSSSQSMEASFLPSPTPERILIDTTQNHSSTKWTTLLENFLSTKLYRSRRYGLFCNCR